MASSLPPEKLCFGLIYRNREDDRLFVYWNEQRKFHGAILNFAHRRACWIMALILLLLLAPCAVVLRYTFSVAAVSGCAVIWAIAVLSCFSLLAEKELKK